MAIGRKTGGRTAGTPNKLTAKIKESLTDIISSEISKLPNILDRLEPKDRAEIVVKLLGYVIPKLKDENNTLNIESVSLPQIKILYEQANDDE